MKKHGIPSVRGSRWCQLDLQQPQIDEIKGYMVASSDADNRRNDIEEEERALIRAMKETADPLPITGDDGTIKWQNADTDNIMCQKAWPSSQMTVSDDVTSEANIHESGWSQLLPMKRSNGSTGVTSASPTRKCSSDANSPIRSSQGSSHASPTESTSLVT